MAEDDEDGFSDEEDLGEQVTGTIDAFLDMQLGMEQGLEQGLELGMDAAEMDTEAAGQNHPSTSPVMQPAKYPSLCALYGVSNSTILGTAINTEKKPKKHFPCGTPIAMT